MRQAEMKVEPARGGRLSGRVGRLRLPGRGRRSVEANIKRWQGLFKDQDGNPPDRDQEGQGQERRGTSARRLHGEYHPAQFPAARPSRSGRAPGCWVRSSRPTGPSYYIRMVGPDKTMKKLSPEFDEMLKTIKVGG